VAELSKNIDQMFKQTQYIVNENITNNKRSYYALYDHKNLNYKSEPSGSRHQGFVDYWLIFGAKHAMANCVITI